MTVTVLTQASAGAPSLTGEDGSLYSVLKWALVELGWTVAFDDAVNFKVAFRNNPATGTGRYLRIRDKAADHGQSADRAAIDSFLTMTDINTGTASYPNQDQYWYKSVSTDATSRDYTIVGTDRWFYFMPRPTAAATPLFRVFFFGDYLSFDETKVDTALLVSSSVTGTLTNAYWGGVCRYAKDSVTSSTTDTNTEIDQGLSSGHTSAGNGVSCHIQSSEPIMSANTTIMAGSLGDTTDPISGGVSTAPAFLVEGNSTPRVGIIPNLLIPMNDLRIISVSNTPGEVLAGIKGPNGVGNAMYVPCTNTYNQDTTSTRMGAVLIDLGTDWLG